MFATNAPNTLREMCLVSFSYPSLSHFFYKFTIKYVEPTCGPTDSMVDFAHLLYGDGQEMCKNKTKYFSFLNSPLNL